MPPTRVQTPDGNTAEFPEGMSQDQIQAVLAKQYPPQASPQASTQPHGWGLSSIMAGTTPLHKAFDAATTVTPEQEAGHGKVVNSLQKFGAGAIQGAGQLFMHPINTVEGIGKVGSALMGDEGAADEIVNGVKSNPWGAAGNAVGGAALGEGLGAAAEPVLSRIPSTARASKVFNNIEQQAKNVPVTMKNTQPALDEFGNSVRTGGKNAPVMTKLANRLDPMNTSLQGWPTGAPPSGPVLFPEARDFYSNVSKATAKPGFLRRAIESPGAPAFRMNAGGVREALNSDLTDAAGTIGRGEDYTQAMKDYRRGAQINHAMKTAGKIAVGSAVAGTPLAKIIRER